MRPSRTTKNKIECKKRPSGVGHPPLDTVNRKPKRDCVSLYVSGFASKKNTRAL